MALRQLHAIVLLLYRYCTRNEGMCILIFILPPLPSFQKTPQAKQSSPPGLSRRLGVCDVPRLKRSRPASKLSPRFQTLIPPRLAERPPTRFRLGRTKIPADLHVLLKQCVLCGLAAYQRVFRSIPLAGCPEVLKTDLSVSSLSFQEPHRRYFSVFFLLQREGDSVFPARFAVFSHLV